MTGLCIRCYYPAEIPSDWCSDCLAWLRGEADDPKLPTPERPGRWRHVLDAAYHHEYTRHADGSYEVWAHETGQAPRFLYRATAGAIDWAAEMDNV